MSTSNGVWDEYYGQLRFWNTLQQQVYFTRWDTPSTSPAAGRPTASPTANQLICLYKYRGINKPKYKFRT